MNHSDGGPESPNSLHNDTTPPPCGIFDVQDDCVPGDINDEDRFLAIVVVALVIAVVALCVVTCLLTVLVHKLSIIWVKALTRPPAETEASEARKGLLQDVKSSFATPSSKAEGKKKKTTFVEDTSCAAPRDVDEEDL